MKISVINFDDKQVLACDYINNKSKNNIGKKIEDFTILQVLGKGSYGFVAKVKSKINHEIYALKKNIISNMNEEQKKEMRNEIIFLKYFNHDYICRCLTSFEQDDNFYCVMKLFNNKDLFNYYFANKKFGIKIKEEILWDIFYQCFEGLTYIHNQGVIHRDIKLQNIFMDNNGKIVIGDLGKAKAVVKNRKEAIKFIKDEKDKEMIDSIIFDPKIPTGSRGYMAPEVLDLYCNPFSSGYNQKADVYSMGICFYGLCFFESPYKNMENMTALKNDTFYSNELKKVIKRMIEKDHNKRPTSSEIYCIFKKYYMTKYMKNSSIYSVVRCLLSFRNFYDYFNNPFKLSKLIDSEYTKKISLNLIEINNSFNDKSCIEESIFDLRKKLNEEGIKEKDNKEILPSSALSVILNSLNYELNEIPPLKGSDYSNYLKDQCKPGEEKETYKQFIEHYKKYFKSIISKDFFGVLKTTRICNECNSYCYLFEKFYYINFNLEIFGKNKDNTPINIYHLIDYINKTPNLLDKRQCISCEKCGTFTSRTEYKNLYDLKKNLIIVFNRGKNQQIKTKIDFFEKVKFDKKYVENISSDKEYILVGVICYSEFKNKYVSFVKKRNEWICYNIEGDSNGIIIKYFDDIKNYGNVISLFYYYKGFEKLFEDNNMNNIMENNCNILNFYSSRNVRNYGLNNINNNEINNKNNHLRNKNNNYMNLNTDRNIMPKNNINNFNCNYQQFFK